MSEASAHVETPPGNVRGPCSAAGVGDPCAALDAKLEALAALAATLPDRLPRVRDPIHGRRVALGMHLLLANLAKGNSAFDLAVAEGLHALSLGDRALHVGYSTSNEYAREVLGISASTAEKLRRLARRLRKFPLIREAVRRGELSLRKAEILVQHAHPGDETRLLLIAQGETVRSLRARLGAPSDSGDDEWLNLSGGARGQDARGPERAESRRQVPQARSQQDGAARDHGPGIPRLALRAGRRQGRRRALRRRRDRAGHERARRAKPWLARPRKGHPMHAPDLGHTIDPAYIDRWLKAQARRREGWDDTVGRVALIFKASRCWGQLGFGSFGQYCEEGLGMSERAVAQRISLERSLQRMPRLRKALQEKRITYEKARVLARHAEPDALPALIDKAASMTCIALRRELEEKEEAQMCARNTVSVWMTVRVAELVKATFPRLRAAAKRWLSPGECLVGLAEHFVETWGRTEERRAGSTSGSSRATGTSARSRAAAGQPRMLTTSSSAPTAAAMIPPTWFRSAPCITCAASTAGSCASAGPRRTALVWEFGLKAGTCRTVRGRRSRPRRLALGRSHRSATSATTRRRLPTAADHTPPTRRRPPVSCVALARDARPAGSRGAGVRNGTRYVSTSLGCSTAGPIEQRLLVEHRQRPREHRRRMRPGVHPDRVLRARLHAEPADDAAQLVDHEPHRVLLDAPGPRTRPPRCRCTAPGRRSRTCSRPRSAACRRSRGTSRCIPRYPGGYGLRSSG